MTTDSRNHLSRFVSTHWRRIQDIVPICRNWDEVYGVFGDTLYTVGGLGEAIAYVRGRGYSSLIDGELARLGGKLGYGEEKLLKYQEKIRHRLANLTRQSVPPPTPIPVGEGGFLGVLKALPKRGPPVPLRGGPNRVLPTPWWGGWVVCLARRNPPRRSHLGRHDIHWGCRGPELGVEGRLLLHARGGLH